MDRSKLRCTQRVKVWNFGTLVSVFTMNPMGNDDTYWLRRVSTQALTLLHNIVDVINGSSCRTIESRRAAVEITQELVRRRRLAHHFEDDSGLEQVKTSLKEKHRRHRRPVRMNRALADKLSR
jgi:hypothetical protein